MKHLLDVSVLLAAIWSNHSRHQEAFDWLADKAVVLCPLAELGFLRISSNPKVINAPMKKARQLLTAFAADHQAERISDDLPPLDSNPSKSEQVTDIYLADLAAKHGLRLATFDTGINHPAVDLVS